MCFALHKWRRQLPPHPHRKHSESKENLRRRLPQPHAINSNTSPHCPTTWEFAEAIATRNQLTHNHKPSLPHNLTTWEFAEAIATRKQLTHKPSLPHNMRFCGGNCQTQATHTQAFTAPQHENLRMQLPDARNSHWPHALASLLVLMHPFPWIRVCRTTGGRADGAELWGP